MAVFSKEFGDEVVKRLKEKGAVKPCPRCNSSSFSLIQGIINNPVVQNTKIGVLTSSAVPTIGLSCDNCGYFIQHSLGSLGLKDWGDAVDK